MLPEGQYFERKNVLLTDFFGQGYIDIYKSVLQRRVRFKTLYIRFYEPLKVLSIAL